jgi:hypothetical protein
MVIGRGRRRENPHFVLLLTKKYGKKIRENSTEKKTTEKKVREKSTEKKEGKKCGRRRKHPQPTICTTTNTKLREKKVRKKSTGKKIDKKSTGKKIRGKSHATSSGKGSTRLDIAQFPVAHAQTILSNRALPVTLLTSLPVKHAHGITSGSSSANMTLSVPIYYLHLIG